jgi:hypothetical protein
MEGGCVDDPCVCAAVHRHSRGYLLASIHRMIHPLRGDLSTHEGVRLPITVREKHLNIPMARVLQK